jgi:hypothetical protein
MNLIRERKALRCGRLFCILIFAIGMAGCARVGPMPGQSTFENDGIAFERYYRVEAPEGGWLRMINLRPSPDHSIKSQITDDALFLKCPDEQTIRVTRVYYDTSSLHNSDEFLSRQGAFNVMVNDAMVNMGGLLSTQYVKVSNRDATEFDYLVSGVPRMCSNSAGFDGTLKSRAIVVHGKGSSNSVGGKYDYILLIYASPADRFDQSSQAFEQMVQSFMFLN